MLDFHYEKLNLSFKGPSRRFEHKLEFHLQGSTVVLVSCLLKLVFCSGRISMDVT